MVVQQQQATQETIGQRFETLYAEASSVLVYAGEIRKPDGIGRSPQIEIPGTHLTYSTFLYRGESLDHLNARISLVGGGVTRNLFSITASAASGSALEDFNATRIEAYRGEESEGDYALARSWETQPSGIVVGRLGRTGLGAAEKTAERTQGMLKAKTGESYTELSPQQRQLLDLISAGIRDGIEAAHLARSGTEPSVILSMLGRQTNEAAQAA